VKRPITVLQKLANLKEVSGCDLPKLDSKTNGRVLRLLKNIQTGWPKLILRKAVAYKTVSKNL
jgi:hypothetical protein